MSQAVLGTSRLGGAFKRGPGRSATSAPRSVRAAAKYKIVDDSAGVSLADLGLKEAAPPPPPAPVPEAPAPAAIPEPASAALPELPSTDDLLGSVDALTSQATGALGATASDVADKAAEFASGATEAVSDLTESLTGSVSDLTGSLAGSVTGLADSVSDLTGSLTGSVSDVTGAITGSVSDVTGAITGSVSGLTGALSSSVTDLSSTVGGGVLAAKDTANQTIQAASGAVTSALSEATGAVSGVLSEATSTLDATTRAASDAVNTVLTTVNSTTAGVIQEVDQAVGGVTQQVWSSIPPEAQGVLAQVGEVVGSAASLAVEYPLPTLVVVGAVTIPSAITSYAARFGGYAGELAPGDVRELLAGEEPALLLDIRPDGMREKDGLPELKLGARFKAAALPLSIALAQVSRMDPRLLKSVTNKDELVLAVHAAFVSNLKQVPTPLTKVVVMDKEGSDAARDVARALRAEGIYSAYVMQGGFREWVSEDLPVTTSRNIDYDASAADLISDNLEIVAQRTGALLTRLKEPGVAIPVATTTALGAVSVYYYETTLQVIGLAGMSWSLYSELSKYENPKEAVEAWRSSITKLFTPKPKPVLVNGKPIPEDFVPPKLPAPAAAARAEEVLQQAAKEAAEAAAARKAAANLQAASKAAAAAAAAAASPPAPTPQPAAAKADAPKPAAAEATPAASAPTQAPAAVNGAAAAAGSSQAPAPSQSLEKDGSVQQKVIS